MNKITTPFCDLLRLLLLVGLLWSTSLVAQSTTALEEGFTHRIDQDADIYFVSNQVTNALTIDCFFRVTGKVPELWHPDMGKKETLALYSCSSGVTTLPIHFDRVGAAFVIFRPSTNNDLITSVSLDGVKRFSGSNDSAFGLPKQKFNGKALGIFHKEPFRVEITDTVQVGENDLEIKVTNLWPNRLIGDRKLPDKGRTT